MLRHRIVNRGIDAAPTQDNPGGTPMDANEKPRTLIAEDVEITGNIKCESNIQIDGKLNGDLTCSGNAIIGNTCVVKGNLTVATVSILGQVNGNIAAKDKIELKSTARLTGDIRSRRLTVEDGVTFVGKADVNPAGHQGTRQQSSESKPAETPPAVESDSHDTAPKGGFLGRR
jgi:cytoskeletal protein CcmA (bactofilin family)